jgi:hypothetical protein
MAAVALEAEPTASTPPSTNASPDNSDVEAAADRNQAEGASTTTKPKKKKKRKTPAQKRAAAEAAVAAAQAAVPPPAPVLKISRNKHMKVSSVLRARALYSFETAAEES